jgi:CheY-like chemotaxis protein
MEVRVTIEPPTATIAADPDRLQQVVWNLLSNAIKFTPAGGSVDLRGRQSDQGTEIVVKDTGPGVSSNVLPFIFERFRQADSSTTRGHGGMGLGLAIVRHLVELHGGSVDAESDGEGRGATFIVRLPIASGFHANADVVGPAASIAQPEDWPLLTNVRVVVVDDDPDAREVLSTVLSRSGAEVTAVESAAQALAHIESRAPDVIIADIGMPDEDGYAFIEKVRTVAAGRGGEAPAIALTAYARGEDRARALAAGYQLHIAKPFDPAAVVKAVAQLSGQTQRHS